MAEFTYNGVTLPYVNIDQFDQVAVREDSDTDRIYTKFDIRLTAVLNAGYLSSIFQSGPSPLASGSLPITDVTNLTRAVRQRLLADRKALSVKFNGVELIPTTGGTGTVDAMNGPKPQECNLIDLTNNTYLLTYRITAHYWEAVNSLGNPVTPGDVLYNRWSETVDIDDCQYSKRTRQGKFIIRSDNPNGYTADEVRSQMAVVGVPAGFLRESSQYTVTPDGLGIQYTVVDKEVYKMPPSPSFKAGGECIVTTTHLGAQRFAEVRVVLDGPKDARQDALIKTACFVAARKVLLMGATPLPAQTPGALGGQAGVALLQYGLLLVGLYENHVEARLKCRLTAPLGTVSNIPGFNGTAWTFTPGSDGSSYTPPYTDRGTAGLLLQAARYYDPNFTDPNLAPGVQTTSNQTTTQGGDANVQLSRGLEPGQAGFIPE